MSGNRLAAARRLEFALALLAAGEVAAAAAAAEAATEADPSYPEAWFALAESRQRAGEATAAATAYRRYLHEEPQDRLGAIVRLAALGAEPAPAGLPPAYVQALFDDYAPRFDRSLREGLAYRGPELIAGLLLDAEGRPRPFRRALDLGCGTGLVGLALREQVERLEGLDLSPAMLGRARRRGIYDRLARQEVVAGLQERRAAGERYDLVTAGDLLAYLGDLGLLLDALAGVLEPGGRFAATAESQDREPGAMLGPTHRYAHHPEHLRGALAAAGLRVVRLEPAPVRLEGGRPAPSLLLLAERP